MSDTESKPLPRTDADAVSLDLVWAAAYAGAFSARAGYSAEESNTEIAITVADRAVAALAKRRAR